MSTHQQDEQRQPSEKPGSPAERRDQGKTPGERDREHEEEIRDEELDETFPASDPPPAQPGTTKRGD